MSADDRNKSRPAGSASKKKKGPGAATDEPVPASNDATAPSDPADRAASSEYTATSGNTATSENTSTSENTATRSNGATPSHRRTIWQSAPLSFLAAPLTATAGFAALYFLIAGEGRFSPGLAITAALVLAGLAATFVLAFRVPSEHKKILGIAIGVPLAFVGFVSTFLLMANEGRVAHGPAWGMFAMLVGVVGLIGALGLLTGRAADAIDVRRTAIGTLPGEWRFTSPIVTVPLALAIFAIGALTGGYDGLPITIVAALVALLPSAVRRPALLVFVFAGLLYLPFLGVYGLWDPWETHYGEVAHEILSRDDWISLWWAQEDWFWSKPILIFWIEALGMGALGVDYLPDANPAHPEWAIRLPHFVLTLLALLAVHAFVSRAWSKRAGLVAAVVVGTVPHFFFLAHQAITDMPFVSMMTVAMCMLGLAMSEDPTRTVRTYRVGPFEVSGQHAVVAVLSAIVLPQVFYLFSRNVTLMHQLPPFGWHGDVFLSGSAGNHGIPGNAPVQNTLPFLGGPGAEPLTQGLLWLIGYVIVLVFVRRERRAQSLYMFAFYVFCGLAFMAKGIPGFALPGLVALLFLVATRRWELLLAGQLRVGVGVLIVAITGLPWYVAMYVRHGPPFTDRLLIHDHINRLTAGVHGDTGSIEYFVEQLGYGLFPWIALAPLALAGWIESRRRPSDRIASDAMTLITLWAAAAFTLFSAMTTKFHHYIFPAVVPAAMLIGITTDRLIGDREQAAWRTRVVTALALIAPVPLVLAVAGAWGDVRGIVPDELPSDQQVDWVLANGWSTATCLALLALGLALIGAAIGVERPAKQPASWRSTAMTAGLLSAPVLVALVGRDLSWVTDARPHGYERLIHLFVYNYQREWPSQFDYRPILTGFAIVASALVLIAAIERMRVVAVRAFIGVAIAFAAWTLDVYMIDLSPHWGQRELVQEYYRARRSADEPLVAWQMNWKGENFYTGNRVSVFVDLDNVALREWLNQNRGRTAYFLLEHGRLSGLRGVLSDSLVEEVSTERLNNKFILVRATIGQRTPTLREERD